MEATISPLVETESDPRHSPVFGRILGSRLLTDAILSIFGIAFFVPFIWLILSAFNRDATAGFAGFKFSFFNFSDAIHMGAGRAIYNSLYLSLVSTLVATVGALFAAYVLSRKRVPFKGALLVGVLFLSALPSSLLLIPIFQEFVKFHWQNSPFYASLALASASLPFSIWIIKNFIDQIPKDYEEAASVEGANDIRILRKIVFPLTLPGLVVASMLTFVSSWGAFLVPLVLDTNPNNIPGSVGIYNFLSANAGVQYGPLAAYSILFSMPVIGAYFVSVHWLNGGFAFAGGVKG